MMKWKPQRSITVLLGLAKAKLVREANKPSTGTLRPNKADSKDWDTTGNIFIGDNLEVLN